ncbi:hypothetical protein NQ315_012900 [Exocentrus adspersus]|uniref:Uncharacterized protein n=1 Tax=Exocentrus adspersus TaxID=1586481 RepID=A0AAV8V4U1_9CUCU|nr:hypothetical protein NQ315_012900 [Exocentrus adspersus]
MRMENINVTIAISLDIARNCPEEKRELLFERTHTKGTVHRKTEHKLRNEVKLKSWKESSYLP